MAIANDALLYSKDQFDRARFERVRQLAAKLLTVNMEGMTPEQALELFEENDGYQTPKVDTRAVIFNDNDEVLLVKDYDGKWALPGGWCEYDRTIFENTVKEAREEAGIEVKPVRLVAAHSHRKRNNPNSFFYVIRFFVLCDYVSGQFHENDETSEARYFPVDKLPQDMNDHKCSPEQIALCLKARHSKEWEPEID